MLEALLLNQQYRFILEQPLLVNDKEQFTSIFFKPWDYNEQVEML